MPVASTSRSQPIETIDLTGHSPPTTRSSRQQLAHPPPQTTTSDPRRSKRRRVSTSTTHNNQQAIVLDSDSDDDEDESDDEVIVVESSAQAARRQAQQQAARQASGSVGPSGQSGSRDPSAGPSNGTGVRGYLNRLTQGLVLPRSSSSRVVVPPPHPAPPQQAQAQTSRESSSSSTSYSIHHHLPSHAYQNPWGSALDGLFGGMGMGGVGGSSGGGGVGGGGVFYYHGGGSPGGGAGSHLANYFGHGPQSLQGVIPTRTNSLAGRGKKYGVKMSHPRKVEEGFSRDVINPDDSDTFPLVSSGNNGRGKKVPMKEEDVRKSTPGCASCLSPLRLAQSGKGRPWGLKCGHVVCGNCVREARERCQEIQQRERKLRWEFFIEVPTRKKGKGKGKLTIETKGKGKGKAKEVLTIESDDDDEEEEEAMEEVKIGRIDGAEDEEESEEEALASASASSSASKSSAKGKGKSRASETGVEEGWTTCPVSGCDGSGTDMLAKEGDYSAPFELFV